MTMKIILEKLNHLDEIANDTRVKVGKIEEHLKLLNNTVQINTKDIKSIFKNNYKLVGGMGVIILVLTILVNIII